MTGAPVADLDSYLMNYPSTKAAVRPKGKSDFEQIMGSAKNNPTDNREADFKAVNSKSSATTVSEKNTDNAKELEPQKDNAASINNDDKTSRSKAQSSMVNKDEASGQSTISDEELSEISEALQVAVQTILSKASNELAISAEQLQSFMQQNGIENVDLLFEGTMKELAVALKGEGDALKLLTNENLYQSVKELETLVAITEEELSKELSIPIERLNEILKEVKDKPAIEGKTVTVVDETALGPKGEALVTKVESDFTGNTEMTDKINTVGDDISQEFSDGQKEKKNDKSEAEQMSRVQTAVTMTQQVSDSGREVFITRTEIADTERILNQITEYIKVHVKPGVSSVEMQLTPENLGTLNIQIVAREGKIAAQFIAKDETVKAALESQMIQLKESLTEQGLEVESVEVSVMEHGFGNETKQSGYGNETETEDPQKNSFRRINLNELTQEDVLTQEEQLEVDMMIQNGNTVDYTV